MDYDERRRDQAKRWRALFYLALIWVFFKFLDPLNLEHAMSQASEQFFPRIAAQFYGYPNNEAQQRTAVVLVTDATLKELKRAWPLSFADQARILNNILDGSPSAVFVDIMFPKLPRPGDDLNVFKQVIDRANQSNIPILFAKGSVTDSLAEPLNRYGVINAWSAPQGQYPLTVLESGTPQPTVALRMMLAFCEHESSPHCKDVTGSKDLGAFGAPLYLRWGSRTDPDQDRLGADTGSCSVGGNRWARLGGAAYEGLISLFGKLDETLEAKERCDYHLTMGAHVLSYQLSSTGDPAAQLLRGRVVFYGANIKYSHDVLQTSVLQGVAGAEVNAMAFDNLLTYGANYFKSSDKAIPELLNLALWILLAATVVFHDPARAQNESPKAGRLRMLKIVGAGLFLGAALFELDSVERLEQLSSADQAFYFSLYALASGFWSFALIDRGTLAQNPFGRFGLSLGVVSALFVANELVLRWAASDWFMLVLLFLFVQGEAHEIIDRLQAKLFRRSGETETVSCLERN